MPLFTARQNLSNVLPNSSSCDPTGKSNSVNRPVLEFRSEAVIEFLDLVAFTKRLDEIVFIGPRPSDESDFFGGLIVAFWITSEFLLCLIDFEDISFDYLDLNSNFFCYIELKGNKTQRKNQNNGNSKFWHNFLRNRWVVNLITAVGKLS